MQYLVSTSSPVRCWVRPGSSTIQGVGFDIDLLPSPRYFKNGDRNVWPGFSPKNFAKAGRCSTPCRVVRGSWTYDGRSVDTSRTVVASELSQSDVRPLPVLWKTWQYLLGLLDDPEFPFDIVHNFLFDRTRAIRQELGMQRIRDPQNATIHEELVRFHILSQHELRALNGKRSKQIDTHLNLQQLAKSLYSLLNLYIRLGEEDGVNFEHEAEFYAYYVLLNLGNHGQFQAESLSLWLPNVPSNVLHAPPMQFARKVLRYYRSNNYVGFFRLVKEATYLQSCLMELSFDAVRATSLAMLNMAEYKLHPFPLQELGQLLLLEANQTEELCIYYGLLTGLEKGSDKLCLFVKQSQFTVPERTSLPYYSSPFIDCKRAPSFFEQVKGHEIET